MIIMIIRHGINGEYIIPQDTPDTDRDGQSDTQNHMTNGKE